MDRAWARGRIWVLSSKGRPGARADTGRSKTWPLDESDVFEKAERWPNESGCSAQTATPAAGAAASTPAPPTAHHEDAAPPAAAAASKAEPPAAAAGAQVADPATAARDKAADAIVAESIAARASEIERLGVYWGFFEWLAWGWAERCQVCLLVASERTGGEASGAHTHISSNLHVADASS